MTGFIKNSIRTGLRLLNNLGKQSYLKELRYCGKGCKINKPFSSNELNNVCIGNYFHSGERLKLRTFSKWNDQQFSPEIIIGDNVSIQTDCHISAINSIRIDDNVLIASFVYISDHYHGETTAEMLDVPPINRPLVSKGPIHICKKVWLGEKVSVLSGVTIGEGSIIGANSVVTKDIPPYSVACGIPAKVIKTLK